MKTMGEQILKMITTGPDNGNESLASKITFHVFEFLQWYSGMEKAKIENAYKRYCIEVLKEKDTTTAADLKAESDAYYAR